MNICGALPTAAAKGECTDSAVCLEGSDSSQSFGSPSPVQFIAERPDIKMVYKNGFQCQGEGEFMTMIEPFVTVHNLLCVYLSKQTTLSINTPSCHNAGTPYFHHVSFTKLFLLHAVVLL